MKRMTIRWPLTLVGLPVGATLLLFLGLGVSPPLASVFIVLALVGFAALLLLSISGFARSVIVLARRDGRRETGLAIPIVTMLIAVTAFAVVAIEVIAATWVVRLRAAQAHIWSAQVCLARFNVALEAYVADCWQPPTKAQGLKALLADPGVPGWKGPYLDALAPDPWGTPFHYDTDAGGNPIVTSAGPDLEFGTPDDLMQHTD